MLNNSLAGRSVLVVEDEMMVLMFIEGALADGGCEYIAAAATWTRRCLYSASYTSMSRCWM
jgi:hypothetical protein